MDDSIFASGRQKMDGVVNLVKEELMGVQTGRAKPAMVEGIKVEAYEGSWMEIRELANITAPDSQSILINPWDKGVVKKIEAAILKSELNLHPVVDQESIRIQIPSLTEERRKELVKMIAQRVESGKAMLRQVRIEMKKLVDDQKEEEGVSEDDIHRMYDRLQKIMDEYNQKLDQLEESKSKELMTW